MFKNKYRIIRDYNVYIPQFRPWWKFSYANCSTRGYIHLKDAEIAIEHHKKEINDKNKLKKN